MNHNKILLLALFLPAWLAAQQQVIQQHWPAQLSAPQANQSMQLQLSFDQHHLSLQLIENDALLAKLSSGQRSLLQQQGARYFSGHVDGDADSWLRLSWLQGA